MNLQQAIKITSKVLEDKQDPDHVAFDKQWDEFGQLKGWMVNCEWEKTNGDTESVTLDITKGYHRVIGNLAALPDYIKGKHQKV